MRYFDKSSKPINLHIVPDNKFINEFISDVKLASPEEMHIFIAFNRYRNDDIKFTYLDELVVKYAPPNTLEFKVEVGDIKKYKRIFIHWFLPSLEDFVLSIPRGPLVCWCFWGEFDASFGLFSKLLRYEKQSRQYASAADILDNIITKKFIRYASVPFWMRKILRGVTSTFRWIKRVRAIARVDALLHWNEIDRRLLSYANLYFSLPRHEFFYNVVDVAHAKKSLFVDQLWMEHMLDGKTVLLLGHSSFPSGNHLDALDVVANKYDDGDIYIISILSYGDQFYRDVVIRKGLKLFGARFIPVTEFLPVSEYYYLIQKISVAFLNHRYSEGAGNIFRILLEGKPLILNKYSTVYKMLKCDGVEVYTPNDNFNIEDICSLPKSNFYKNKSYIKERFSSEVSIKNIKNFLSKNNSNS